MAFKTYQAPAASPAPALSKNSVRIKPPKKRPRFAPTRILIELLSYLAPG